MKSPFSILVIIAVLLITTAKPDITYSQGNFWQPPVRITNGYTDRNPAFGTKTIYTMSFGTFEFLAFERHAAPYSQICVFKIGLNGPLDSAFYLTSGNSLKRNPSVSYSRYGSVINSSLIMWESNQNGRWDIYGRYYSGGVWQAIRPIDSSAVNKSSPCSYAYDSVNYFIVYEKSGDIIFRHYNPSANTILFDTNLTANDPDPCFNPKIMFHNNSNVNNGYKLVTYEKNKTNGQKAVIFKKAGILPVWTAPDTAAYIGDNSASSLTSLLWSGSGAFSIIFESNRTGKYNIYNTEIAPNGTKTQSLLTNYPNNGNYNRTKFYSLFYPIITDYLPVHVSAHIRKGLDSTKIMFDNHLGMLADSVTIGDTSKNIVFAMNNGLLAPNWFVHIWVIYPKDSAGFTKLYGKKKVFMLGGITRTNSEIPEKFSLSQNYPNPFNPSTKIRFQIPSPEGWQRNADGVGLVILKVYDAAGRKIQALVNEPLQPGTYEVTFDGTGLNSGVYFYQLTAGSYRETRRMILIK